GIDFSHRCLHLKALQGVFDDLSLLLKELRIWRHLLVVRQGVQIRERKGQAGLGGCWRNRRRSSGGLRYLALRWLCRQVDNRCELLRLINRNGCCLLRSRLCWRGCLEAQRFVPRACWRWHWFLRSSCWHQSAD